MFGPSVAVAETICLDFIPSFLRLLTHTHPHAFRDTKTDRWTNPQQMLLKLLENI